MALFGNKKAEDKKAKEEPVKEEKTSMKDLYGDSKTAKKTTAKESSDTKGVKRDLLKSNAYKVLVKPLITEKAGDMGTLNKYVFEVSLSSNKVEIAKAVEGVYGIKVTSVNVINMKGKKIQRGKWTGKRKDWRKAIVTLAKGENIQVYEGI